MATHVTVSKRWNKPSITVEIDKEGIELRMGMADFRGALLSELSGPLKDGLVAEVGNPTMLLSKAQLAAKIEAALSARLATVLDAAVSSVISGIKEETAKVV